MILNFPKIFKGKESASELGEKDSAQVELNNAMPSSTEGRVNIQFTSISPAGGAFLVGFFITNGYSQKVKFGKVPLVLLDSEKRVLAQQTFDGKVIGEVSGGSSKACVVRFLRDNVYTHKIPEDCQLCFDVRPKNSPKISVKRKIQYQNLPEKLTAEQKQELEQTLAKLPPIEKGEANFSPLYAAITPEDNLLATVIIRNATDMPLSLEQIPLALLDANDTEVARGVFDIKTLAIEPYKAILWTFNFEAISRDKNTIDLSSWHINVLHDMLKQ